MAELNTELTVPQIADALGPQEAEEFLSIMRHMQEIIDNPGALAGNEAVILAAKLAALRTKIGVRAQIYKTAEKSISQRRRKDVLLTIFVALEENINTLKLLGRIEAKHL